MREQSKEKNKTQNQLKNIVLFDMDNTLVSANTMDLWGQFLESKGLISEKEKNLRLKLTQDYLNRRLDVTENFRFEISLLKNIPGKSRLLWRDEFFACLVKPKISQTALELIHDYKQDVNTIIILITASLSFIATPVAEYAGFHDLIATEAEIQNNIYTGEISGIASLGKGKLDRFKLWLQKENITHAYTTLYSDSINDLPLLDFVDKPVVVDPDQYLENIAAERNWENMSFVGTPQ